ncbi:MAG: protein kinase [Thermoleophilaceae bacterium]
MSELATGSEFAGHRIEGVAGRGGMGVVYVATHLALDRRVALKVITPQYAEDSGFRERFKRESKTAASINHPNVIPIYHAGEEDGLLYITMYLVEGTDLKDLIVSRGGLPPAEAAGLVSQVGDALDAAHARGLVHRDIKPGNVVIEGSDGQARAYLTDFGLTKKASSQSGLTGTGMFVGTLDYIAPEQLQGKPVDARSDVYALGCVLYQALSGQVPYPRDSEPAKIWAHMGEPPPSLAETAPGVPRDFEEVVGRAMAKEPEQRYPSAGDLGRAALAAAGGQNVAEPERSVAVGAAAGQPGSGATAVASAGATQAVPAGATAPAGPGLGDTPPSGFPAVTPPPSPYPGVAQPAKRSPLPFVLGGVGLVAVLAVILGVFVLGGGDEADPGNPAGDVVGSPIDVGDQPFDMATSLDGTIWIANLSDSSVSKLDEASGGVTPITIEGSAPSAIAASDDGVWAYTFSETITRIDPETNETRDITIPPLGDAVLLEAGAGAAWILDSENERVLRIDAASDEVSEPIDVGAGASGLAVGTDFVFVARENGEIVFISPTTQEVVGRPLEVGVDDLGGVGFVEGRLYVAARNRELREIDVASGVVGEPVQFPSGASFFDIGEDSLWITFPIANELRRFSLSEREPVGEPIEVERSPGGVIVGEQSVWVAHPNGDVVVEVDPGEGGG